MSQHDADAAVGEPDSISRRKVLLGGASATALVWAAPGLARLSVAYAAGTCQEPQGESITLDPASSPWVVPAGVTCFTVEVWGAGGDGGIAPTSGGAAGGGGGAYARSDFTGVTPGTSYPYDVGTAPGGASEFSSGATLVSAPGGGSADGIEPGLGGAGTSLIGDDTSPGANGGGAVGNTGGAGGDAGNATGTGGDGGGNNQDGGPGTEPGGGGGGGGRSPGQDNRTAGGAGANGRIVVTY